MILVFRALKQNKDLKTQLEELEERFVKMVRTNVILHKLVIALKQQFTPKVGSISSCL